jgi:hypothetical protein
MNLYHFLLELLGFPVHATITPTTNITRLRFDKAEAERRYLAEQEAT